jgi:hypothetical protein
MVNVAVRVLVQRKKMFTRLLEREYILPTIYTKETKWN